MKESVGYTVTINIVITFVVIVFTFLSGALIYYKSNKVSKTITEIIEKYEGYNYMARNEITAQLESIGYTKKKIKECPLMTTDNCVLTDHSDNGYCIYICREPATAEAYCEDYYYYKIRTNMAINIPLINEFVDFPIYSTTNRMYNFEKNKCGGLWYGEEDGG